MSATNRGPPRVNTVRGNSAKPKRKKKSGININQLPPEVLSYIMFMGVESDRQVWGWGSSGMRSQQIASKVCRHWRDVAISTPALWTFVHVRTTQITEWTRFNLAHAGPNVPLDIAIDISGRGRYNKARLLASRALFYLSDMGANPFRWKTLLIRFNQDHGEVLSSLARFTTRHSVPILKWIRFDSCHTDTSGAQDPMSSDVTLGASLSNLRHLELISPSDEYIYLSTQTFTKLITLTITSYELHPSHLSNILLSNPHLESLHLCNDCRISSHDQLDFNHMRRTNAPSLRSLFIQTTSNASWALHMAATIQAPKLAHFALACEASNYSGFRRLMMYITTGVRSVNSTQSDSAGGPIYPSLRSLDVHRFSCQMEHFQAIICSFLHLTYLTACTKQVGWLDRTPWVLPNLQYLGVPDLPICDEVFQGFLTRRADFNIPIKEIEAKGSYLRIGTAQHKPPNLNRFSPLLALQYEHYQNENITVGYFQTLQWISPRIPWW